MIITALIILFILLFVLLAVLTFARDVLVTIIAAIVGLFRKGDRMQKKTEGRQTIRRRDRKKQKVYSDSDGEYVDFEEVKK
ncbi:MAG: DUF4834 family protein [Bacteroidaceae bacterium]|jgi:cell division protein FtsB|nr:DUF4834 family protein [Bacteroidaceae bacterium]MBP5347402.1 DUF4834 family protein [Bacteroidaceae bacterium]